MAWLATVLTIFPEMFPGPLGVSLAGKAAAEGIWRLETVDIRGFARDKHRSVDDGPFGGGPGMVMRPDVVDAAIEGAGGDGPLVYLSPRGRLLDQRRVRELAAGPGVRLICGRFEGVDERVLEARAVEEISLGDFVLSGGEPAALALLDACIRVLPGVVGAAASLAEEFRRGIAGVSPLYAAAGLAGSGSPGGVADRAPWKDPRLAPGACGRDDAAASTGCVGPLSRLQVKQKPGGAGE
jgi:tRNA (guanine37-N1)-methyltransferase